MKHTGQVECLYWRDVREQVHQVNPELAVLIDDIDPSDEYRLYRVKYPFGATLADYGNLHIANEQGTIVPLDHRTVPKHVQDDLNYNPVPVSLVLENNAEVYVIHETRFVPLKIFEPGEIFGVWEILDPPQFIRQAYNWSFSSGARSLFMLPKITEATSHSKLRQKYGLRPFAPKALLDHHKIFTSIANNQNFNEDWHNSILFFSSNWIKGKDPMIADPAWSRLGYFLLKQAWLQSLNWRNQLSFELIWQSLANEIEQRNLKPRRYIIDTVKHLIGVGTGTAPAFAPAVDSHCAPIASLQDVYVNDYGLKHYIPTVMQPKHLDMATPGSTVYYSLQTPTLVTYSSAAINTRSTLQDLRDLKFLISILMEKLERDDAPIYELVKRLRFSYFHSEVDNYGEVELSAHMPEYDPALIQTQHDYPGRRFAETGPFARGCIRLSIAKEDEL